MKKLIIILMVGNAFAVTTEDIYDNSYALIIGIDKYENVSNLDYAVKDAESVANLLKENLLQLCLRILQGIQNQCPRVNLRP